jgi:hypothetical protein
MARPAKALGTKRTLRIDIRLTPDEQSRLFARATEQGLSVSDLVRSAILNSKPIMRKANPERAVLIKGLGELGKIGSNLNQIAHELHRVRLAGGGQSYSENDVRLALQGIRQLSDHLHKILSGGSH